MNVSDAVIRFLENIGLNHVFTLSGGGIMYLLDSLGKSEQLNYVCNYHEQACAVAADGYARITGFGVCMVTFGPGAVNALSGVVGAWYDSVPMLVISGQVRSDLKADYSKVRQIGPQEGDVLSMVGPVAKYAISLSDPRMVLVELEKAYHIAKSGRPGPVWIEIPLDIQAKHVDWKSLPRWKDSQPSFSPKTSEKLMSIVQLIQGCKRPVLVLGNGIRLAKMREEALKLVSHLGIPTLIPFTGKDLIHDENPNSFGVFGIAGQRHANIIIQNSDLILGLGVGFNVAKTGFETDKFAPDAIKIFVDIDAGQLEEHPLKPDHAINADLREFIPNFLEAVDLYRFDFSEWLNLCLIWKKRYPLAMNHSISSISENFVNTYEFMATLSELSSDDDTLVTGNGLDCVSFYQAFKMKPNQRSILNGNWGSMGWDLPSAVGASYATGGRIVCVTGDGSIMLNSQELLTIGANDLEIKIFVFNNEGYGSIKSTQKNFFEGRFVGCNAQSNVDSPDFANLSAAYRIDYTKIQARSQLVPELRRILGSQGPHFCEIIVSPDQWISPKATSYRNSRGEIESKPLDDMYPFLEQHEVIENRRLARDIGS